MTRSTETAKPDHNAHDEIEIIEIDSDGDDQEVQEEYSEHNNGVGDYMGVGALLEASDADEEVEEQVEEEVDEQVGEEVEEQDSDEESSDSDSRDLHADCASSSSSLSSDTDIESEVECENEHVARNLIKNHRSSARNPKDIVVKEPVADISCHSASDMVAIADVEGDIIFAKFGVEASYIIGQVEVHNRACRAIDFNGIGDTLFSASRDKCVALIDTETMQPKHYYDDAHDNPLTVIRSMDPHCFATGDEVGICKVWDLRVKKAVFSSRHIDDYISSILYYSKTNYIACTSCDGTLSAYDWRQKKLITQSDPFSSDLTCSTLFRNDSRIVCGTGTGSLLMFSWRNFDAPQESYSPCPSKEINCIVGATENIAVTGWEDGYIRALHLYPHRRIGVVGQHSQTVENLDISYSGQYIASAGFEEVVKFWDITFLTTIDKLQKKDDSNSCQLPSSNISDRHNFFSDLV